MKTPVSPAAYTNAILTVIAIALVLLVVNAYRVDVASPAQAQTMGSAFSSTSGRTSAPVDTSNVAQVQDTAVAGATREVADANRAIAEAIRELAKAVQTAGSAAKGTQPAATGTGTSGIEVDVR